MEEKLRQIEQEAAEEIDRAESPEDLQRVKIKYLGRKGPIAEMLRHLPTLPEEERPRIGKIAHTLKQTLSAAVESKLKNLEYALRTTQHATQIDITLPGIREEVGRLHLMPQIIGEIIQIFHGLGFKAVEGPEIETEYYNFEALNIPRDHPSRETFHTFYLQDDILLRSHTSPVQVRVMEKERPPLRIVVPGKVFRPDATDASHSAMFHQVEGLMVDRGVRFSDLKGVLSLFIQKLFGADVQTRFRPHFFPFTEPSAEVDISCIICKGKGCSTCSRKGWMEILGAGMVAPNVFKAVGYNSEKFTGFAFGMGVERIAMLKYGINDIRLFFENDLRFLSQF